MLMLLMVLSVLALQDLVVPNSSKSKAPRAYVLLLESGLQRVRALLDSDFDRFFRSEYPAVFPSKASRYALRKS